MKTWIVYWAWGHARVSTYLEACALIGHLRARHAAIAYAYRYID